MILKDSVAGILELINDTLKEIVEALKKLETEETDTKENKEIDEFLENMDEDMKVHYRNGIVDDKWKSRTEFAKIQLHKS